MIEHETSVPPERAIGSPVRTSTGEDFFEFAEEDPIRCPKCFAIVAVIVLASLVALVTSPVWLPLLID